MPLPNQVGCAACEAYATRLILGLCPDCRMKQVRPAAKYEWTRDRDYQLAQVYRRVGAKKNELSKELTRLCKAFGYPRTALMNRARVLGLNHVRPFKPWTDKEKDALRKLCGLLGVVTIAKKLGRSPDAIKAQLTRMNLSSEVNDGYTIHQLQQLMGVPNRSIMMWLSTSELNIGEGTDRITESSVRNFLRHNLFEISFKRADEFFIKSMLVARKPGPKSDQPEEFRRAA